MEGFIEIEAGLWYEEATGKPYSTKRKRKGKSKRTDWPLKELKSKTYGYYHVVSKGKVVLWHRLVFEFFHGTIPPKMQVDHDNNIRDDNRIVNLKLLTHKENQAKRVVNKNNTTGLPGIYLYKQTNKWQVAIRMNGKLKHLGLFNSPLEAYSTFLNKKIEISGKDSITPYPTLQEAKKIIKNNKKQ